MVKNEEEKKAAEEAEAKAKAEADAKAAEDEGKKEEPGEAPLTLKEAQAEREKMEAATKAAKTENDRAEDLHNKRILSGDTRAGGAPPKPKTEQEKWEEGAKERYAGTGLDPTPDDTPTTYS